MVELSIGDVCFVSVRCADLPCCESYIHGAGTRFLLLAPFQPFRLSNFIKMHRVVWVW